VLADRDGCSKILALGNQQVAQGRVKPIADVANKIGALTEIED